MDKCYKGGGAERFFFGGSTPLETRDQRPPKRRF